MMPRKRWFLSLLCVQVALFVNCSASIQEEDFGEQVNCMTDYLHQEGRSVVDVYVEATISGEFSQQQQTFHIKVKSGQSDLLFLHVAVIC